jgi:hypothetical protein
LTLNPAAGYFFIDKFAGGLKFAYAVSNPKGYKATTQYLAGPFLRYYFLPANQKVNIFFDGTYGFGSAHNEYGSFNSNMYVFAAGPAIFLNPHTALEFAVNYSSTGGELYGNGSRYNVVGFNIGFQIYLGK